MPSQLLGVDTVHLTLAPDAVKFSPRFADALEGQLSFKPERNLILCLDDCGFPLVGSKAWHNSDNFKLDLSPAGLRLILSAASYSGDNSVPLDLNGLCDVSERAASDLRDAGLDADWLGAKVWRSDVSRNLELTHSAPAYIDLWRGAPFPANTSPRFDGSHSLIYTLSKGRSWSRQWGFYDKGLEREQKALKAAKSRRRASNSNLLRAELRLQRGAVGEALGVEKPTLADFLRPASFDALGAAYRASADSKLLSMLSDDSGLSPADDSLASALSAAFEQLAAAHSLGNCKTKGFYVSLLLARGGLAGAYDWVECNLFPEPASETKRQRASRLSKIRRENKLVRDAWAFLHAGKPASCGASRSELVKEIRAAILA
jgi:hypothetical protein